MLGITMSQFLGEMLGSFTLIAFGVGVSMNLTLNKSFNEGNKAALSGPLAWGFAVAMAVIVSMPFDSGGHFNPAVSVGFAVAGIFEWNLVPGYIVAQCIGSFFGAILSWIVYKSQFEATANEPSKTLIVFATNAAVRNPVINFFSETVATFFLLFVILMMIAADGAENIAQLGATGALKIGFLIFTIGMAYGGVTGWSLNPTRDLMPRLVHQLFPIKGKGSSDWSYGIRNGAIAPLVGGVLAGLLFLLVKDYILV